MNMLLTCPGRRHRSLHPQHPTTISFSSSPWSGCSLWVITTLMNTFRSGFTSFRDQSGSVLNPYGVLVWVTLTLLVIPTEAKYAEGYLKTNEVSS